MTKEFAQLLVDHYNKGLQEIKKSPGDVRYICTKYKIDLGICWCASAQFNNEDLYIDPYVKKINESVGNDENGYWVNPPAYCHDIEEIIKVLQFRVDQLNEFINDPGNQ